MQVLILFAAEDDVREAVDFYNAEGAGLGDAFEKQFREGVNRIATHPYAWQAVTAVHRRYRLTRFPYGIIYRVDATNETVTIEAVRHLSREPRA